MATRKDQLQSYQFMMQRVISSIMVHETDPEQTPLRRGVGAVFGGVMLTGLLAIAFGVYGVISGNIGNRWQEENAIIIERETGAHYVYQGGVLQPVLNYASARLLTGDAEARRVPARNLAGIPRRVPVGIPGAPDSLPAADRVIGPPWTMCSSVGRDPSGAPLPSTALLVGDGVPGMFPIAHRGVLVRDHDDRTHYLIWNSHRHRLEDHELVIQTLYGREAEPVPVGPAWLNALPAGADIAPIEVDGLGEPSSQVDGRAIGDLVYQRVTGGDQVYLVLDDGLAALTPLQVQLVQGLAGNEAEEVTAADVRDTPASDSFPELDTEAPPPPIPPDLEVVPPDGRVTLCADTFDGRSPPRVTIGGELNLGTAALPTPGESPEGVRLADAVLVPPGYIAVVRALPSDTSGVGAFNLVTDIGVRYPVPSEEVLTTLGYAAASAVDMPAALVQRIPAGPTLDPAAAQSPAAAG